MNKTMSFYFAVMAVGICISFLGGLHCGKEFKKCKDIQVDTTYVSDTIWEVRDSIVVVFGTPRVQRDTIYVDTLKCDTLGRKYTYEIADSSFEYFRIKAWVKGHLVDGGAEYKLKPLPKIVERTTITVKEPYLEIDKSLRVLGGATYLHNTLVPNVGLIKHRGIVLVGYDFTMPNVTWKNIQVSGFWIF